MACRVPTLERDAPVTLRPGTQDGAKVRLRNQGIKYLRGSGSGDMVVVVRVLLPRVVTERQRQLLLDFAQEERLRKAA